LGAVNQVFTENEKKKGTSILNLRLLLLVAMCKWLYDRCQDVCL